MSEPRVRRAQDGDRAAFEELYREHVGRVFAVCLRMAGDRGTAEELTQDVFIQAWRTLGSFRGDSAFGSWLHRLAVNVVLGRVRADKRRWARVFETDDAAAFEREGRCGSADTGIDLERAIAALPEGARTVFVLYDVEGYTHEEIARLTGIASGTSKAQLHRARRLLREALDR